MDKYNASKGIKSKSKSKRSKKTVVADPVEDEDTEVRSTTTQHRCFAKLGLTSLRHISQVDDEDAQEDAQNAQGANGKGAEEESELTSEEESDELDSEDSQSTASSSNTTAQSSHHVKSKSSK